MFLVSKTRNLSERGGQFLRIGLKTEVLGRSSDLRFDGVVFGTGGSSDSDHLMLFGRVFTAQIADFSRKYARLSIFDALGSEMATLVDEQQSEGLKETQWNASGAVSGVYFCILHAGSSARSKKILLAK